MSSPTQIGRWESAIRRVFGLQGHQGLNITDDIFPGIQLADLDAPDYCTLNRNPRFATYGAQVAVAGERASVLLGNPTGSGYLIIIERVSWTSGALSLRLGMAFTFIAATNSFAKDARRMNGGVGVGGRSTVIGLSSIGGFINQSMWGWEGPNLQVAAGELVDPGIVLPPGYVFGVEHTSANAALSANFEWRERSFGEQESPGAVLNIGV